jgi:hypothetical protein
MRGPLRGIDRHASVVIRAAWLLLSRLKKNLVGRRGLSLIWISEDTTTYTKDMIMKLTTLALASAFALSATAAFASTAHHNSAVTADRGVVGTVQLHPNYGNPNGNPDGPTTLSGPGDSSFGGASPGTSGYN